MNTQRFTPEFKADHCFYESPHTEHKNEPDNQCKEECRSWR